MARTAGRHVATTAVAASSPPTTACVLELDVAEGDEVRVGRRAAGRVRAHTRQP